MSSSMVTDKKVEDVRCKVTKTSYDKIVKNIRDTWPEWKKNLCNEELIISVKSRKI